MKHNRSNSYILIFIVAIIPFILSLNYFINFDVAKDDLIEVNAFLAKDVKHIRNYKNNRIVFYLVGYSNEFVISSLLIKEINYDEIIAVANKVKKVKLKILKPRNRSAGDQFRFMFYNKIDIIELEINDEKYLNLEVYNNVTYLNKLSLSLLFFCFGIIFVYVGFIERNYKAKGNL